MSISSSSINDDFFNLTVQQEKSKIPTFWTFCDESDCPNIPYLRLFYNNAEQKPYLDIICSCNNTIKNKSLEEYLEWCKDKTRKFSEKENEMFCLDHNQWWTKEVLEIHENMKFDFEHLLIHTRVSLNSTCKKHGYAKNKYYCSFCLSEHCKKCVDEKSILNLKCKSENNSVLITLKTDLVPKEQIKKIKSTLSLHLINTIDEKNIIVFVKILLEMYDFVTHHHFPNHIITSNLENCSMISESEFCTLINKDNLSWHYSWAWARKVPDKITFIKAFDYGMIIVVLPMEVRLEKIIDFDNVFWGYVVQSSENDERNGCLHLKLGEESYAMITFTSGWIVLYRNSLKFQESFPGKNNFAQVRKDETLKQDKDEILSICQINVKSVFVWTKKGFCHFTLIKSEQGNDINLKKMFFFPNDNDIPATKCVYIGWNDFIQESGAGDSRNQSTCSMRLGKLRISTDPNVWIPHKKVKLRWNNSQFNHKYQYVVLSGTNGKLYFYPVNKYNKTDAVEVSLGETGNCEITALMTLNNNVVIAGNKEGFIYAYTPIPEVEGINESQTSILITMRKHEKAVLSLCSSTVNNYEILSGGGEGVVKIWNINQSTCWGSFVAYEKNGVTALECLQSKVGEHSLMTGSDNGILKLWMIVGDSVCLKNAKNN